MATSEQDNAGTDRAGARRPYSKPQVQIYGDLRDLTNAIGKNGAVDNSPTVNMQSHA
jgi:hypothetical protein